MPRHVTSWIVMCICSALVLAGEAAKPADPPGKKVGKIPAYYCELAVVHASYNKIDEAAKCYAEAIKLEETPAAKAEYSMTLGELLVKHNRPADAGKIFLETIGAAKERDAFKLCRRAATACRKAKQNDLAELLLKKAVELAKDPRDKASARMQLMIFRKATDQVDAIAVEFLKRLKANPRDEEALAWLAEFYLLIENNIEKGARTYEKLLALRPDDPQILEELAVLYLTNTESAMAIEMFKRMAEADKTRAAYAFEQIATIEALNGNIKKAIEWNNRVFAAGGETPDRLFRQAKLYTRDKQFKKAIEHTKKAIAGKSAKGESVDTCQLELIKIYKLTGRTQDAIKLAEHIVETTKSDRTRRIAKAQLDVLKGKNAPKKNEKE